MSSRNCKLPLFSLLHSEIFNHLGRSDIIRIHQREKKKKKQRNLKRVEESNLQRQQGKEGRSKQV
jgi:hypothetical protein